MRACVYAIATMDTKGVELRYVARKLQQAGVDVETVDVGTLEPPLVEPSVSRAQVLAGRNVSRRDDRGSAVTAMGEALRDYLLGRFEAGEVAGLIGIGGSGGTALITAAMRALPVGVPKVMVSTVASGQTAPYIGCSDITMMFSVVDIAGLNVVSKQILANAAHAVAGMVLHPMDQSTSRAALGATMFGVTTPCVTAIRERLETEGYDCLVFHATGTGGRSMEKLVESGMISGVLDVTTTEVADEIVGGIFAAGPRRLEISLKRKIPLVLSVGAVDMVNFGPRESVPGKFQGRTFHQHNRQITLMRTTVQENREIAGWIADKLNQATVPLTIVLPEGGVSALDAPGAPFYDPEADAALFSELEAKLEENTNVKLVRLPYHINDTEFAASLVAEFKLVQSQLG